MEKILLTRNIESFSEIKQMKNHFCAKHSPVETLLASYRSTAVSTLHTASVATVESWRHYPMYSKEMVCLPVAFSLSTRLESVVDSLQYLNMELLEDEFSLRNISSRGSSR